MRSPKRYGDIKKMEVIVFCLMFRHCICTCGKVATQKYSSKCYKFYNTDHLIPKFQYPPFRWTLNVTFQLCFRASTAVNVTFQLYFRHLPLSKSPSNCVFGHLPLSKSPFNCVFGTYRCQSHLPTVLSGIYPCLNLTNRINAFKLHHQYCSLPTSPIEFIAYITHCVHCL